MDSITIYDYNNRETKVMLTKPKKEIRAIFVIVLTGDEVVEIEYNDGSIQEADSSDFRISDYYDGGYIVTNENIENWLNFKYSSKDDYTISYKRMEVFDND